MILWQRTDSDGLAPVMAFLLKREAYAVQIVSQLLDKGQFSLPPASKATLLRRTEGDTITGVILTMPQGTIYPLLDRKITPEEKEQLIPLMASLVPKPHGVIGEYTDVCHTDSLLLTSPQKVIHYDYMVRESLTPVVSQIPEGTELRRATVLDTSKLLNLEVGYQIEEVLTDPSRASRFLIHQNLKKRIKNRTLFYLKQGRNPVCKGGDSYTSLNYYLLGGIYTPPSLRNQGLACCLTGEIINHFCSLGQKAALFVKTHNTSAIRLYRNLDFIKKKNYTINYY